MHKSKLLAVMSFTLTVLPVVIGATWTNKTGDDPCDRRNHTCWYPEMCRKCSKNIQHGFIRKEIFYFNNDTLECEKDVGYSDSCNSFDTYRECAFLCGLSDSDED
ncbi:uncharacterized protein LOC142564197 [Dermacentor variabilis]|uniref:uncharacterized protein LOC142564197 n=1 Tax=Dermacentor variabilis TaxID=34621 RepID=UPI003F5C9E2E